MAVKKGLGPWSLLSANFTDEMPANAVCLGGQEQLRTVYNSRPNIMDALNDHGYGPLTCPGTSSSGGGLSWGGGYECATYILENTQPGDWMLDVGSITVDVVGCVSFIHAYSSPVAKAMANTRGIVISRFEEDQVTHKLNIPFPSKTDPKLIPVPKTTLEPGLYEFLFVLEDGRLLSRFLEFTVPTTLKADYASFTNVNIYPVPVNDKVFAIDMDLALPTAVSIQIVNGQGTTYYTKDLVFELAGRNKHVVDMAQPWPNGLYHAILTYQDGSSTTRSLIVNIE